MNYIDQTRLVISGLESHAGDITKLPHVAAMRSEYDSDQSRCLTTVHFLPAIIRERIKKLIIEPLQAIEPEHYFYPPDDLHLTLKNIRANQFPSSFSDDDIQKVDALLARLIPTLPPLHFTLEGALLFPTNIWLAGYADESLERFIHLMDQELEKIGLKDDRKRASDKYFWTNISVCRFVHTPGPKLIEIAKELRHVKLGEVIVDHLELVTGNTALQKGSRKILERYNFASR